MALTLTELLLWRADMQKLQAYPATLVLSGKGVSRQQFYLTGRVEAGNSPQVSAEFSPSWSLRLKVGGNSEFLPYSCFL
jgi:hypothetical protein